MRRRTDRYPSGIGGDPRQTGFTLVEMAIAVALFGMMVSGALFGMRVYFDKIADEKTRDNLTKIERALGLYVAVNGALPSPDLTADGNIDGSQDPPPPACAGGDCAFQGVPPWLDLGLLRDDVIDGYGRFISYAVSDTLTGSNTMSCGGVTYTDANNSALLEPLANLVADNWPATAPIPPRAAYALIFHGKNGFGAVLPSGVQSPPGPNQDETHNAQVGERFGAGPRAALELATSSTAAGFDDVIRTRTPAQILFDNGCPNG